jgi:flagellar biosynthesis/type III secretory pathway M-ring protein FliF/YscJ
MEVVLAVVIVVLVAWFVTAPLRRRPSTQGEDPMAAELADLEARKQAKYRQIRDAEADHAAGKLTDEDFRRLDTELRADAIEILKRIDRLRAGRERAPQRDPSNEG